MNGSKMILLLVAALVTTIFSAFDSFRNRDSERFEPVERKAYVQDKDVATVVMREGIPQGGGYTYQYPETSIEPLMTDLYAAEGDLSMQIELDAGDYSGAAVCIAGNTDLIPYLETGSLDFWIRGEKGGESAMFVLLDDGVQSNGENIQVKLRNTSFGKITTEWKKFSIPLKNFGKTGVFWDVKNQKEVTLPFNWSAFIGFRIEIRKDENESFKVWVDDVVIKKSMPAWEGPSGYPFRNTLG